MEYHDHKFNPINWRYVKGAMWPILFTASENIKAQALTEKSTSVQTPTKATLKTIMVYRAGTVRTRFSYYLNTYCGAEIYLNSTLIAQYIGYPEGEGDTEDQWLTVVNDISVKCGDEIILKGFTFTGAPQVAKVKDFTLLWDTVQIILDSEIITN